MKVDPNKGIEMVQESVLCEGDEVVMYDDSRTPMSELRSGDNAFVAFCA